MSAELALVGGRVFTADPAIPFVTAVAVGDGRIVAVGPGAEELIGASTQVIDLEGALATPGFIDAHVHPVSSGLDRLRISFEGSHDARTALDAVGRYAADHPDLPWIVGSGWSQAWFEAGCPSAPDLDAVVGDRPALIMNTDGHGAWVSSRALELAGITASTPDPADGRIERRPDGAPQGTLHEGAVHLVARHAPEDSVEDYERGLIRGQDELIGYGITGWQDAAVSPEIHEAYVRVAGSGQLIGNVVGALWWDRHRGLDQVDELVARREQSAPGFEPTSVKLMLDGVAENHTASVLDPYLDGVGNPTGNLGVDFIDPDELASIVTALDSSGFQCHFHALGDRAVRNALDAIEAAVDANGPSDNRHHLAHLQFVHPDDVARFPALRAVANAQPLWACNDAYQTELTRPFVTPQRDSWQYPFGSLLRVGAKLGMGSDWGVSTANVMEEIDVAVSRTCPEGEPLGPEEAMTPIQALVAFTLGSAYINHCEQDRGSVAVGKLADLVVLDRDPLREGPIRDAEVVSTIAGGRVVYER